MIDNQEHGSPDTDLKQAVRDRIVQRTNGRVQPLQVDLVDNRVVVRGVTTSYYLKQLAIQAVVDVIEATAHDGTSIDMDLTVVRRGTTEISA